MTIDGKLVDRKYGHGNSIFNIDGTVHNTNRAESALTQARSQLTAAAGTPVKWEVSIIEGATGLDKLFKANDINIEVVYIAQDIIKTVN